MWETGTQVEGNCISHLTQTATVVTPTGRWGSVFFPSLFQSLILSLQSRGLFRCVILEGTLETEYGDRRRSQADQECG